MIKLILKSAYQNIPDNILYITQQLVFIEIQVYKYSNIISYPDICYDR